MTNHEQDLTIGAEVFTTNGRGVIADKFADSKGGVWFIVGKDANDNVGTMHTRQEIIPMVKVEFDLAD